MSLALPVFHPRRVDHVLLKPGATLDNHCIVALRELGVNRLYIQYPPLRHLLRFVSAKIVQEHARLTSALAECFDTVSRDVHAPLEFSSYAGAVRTLVDKVVMDPEAAVFVHDMADARHPVLSHCSNVCYLAILMGLKLDGYLVSQRPRISPARARNIENLGVGAMLHDVGLLRLSPRAIERWQSTHDESDLEFQKHCKFGFEMVRGKIAPTAAAAVLHHHQRFDGTGFPRRRGMDGIPRPLSGRAIHIFARIVAVADMFDRVRTPPKPGEPPVPAARALKLMLPMVRARALDPVVFNALLSVVPAYAPGTVVLLSDGTTAAVSDWSPLDPCRPVVTPIPSRRESAETPAAIGEPIHLHSRPDLSIVMADGEVVEHDDFSPLHPAEFDLRLPSEGYLLSAAAQERRRKSVELPGVTMRVRPRGSGSVLPPLRERTRRASGRDAAGPSAAEGDQANSDKRAA